MKIIKKGLIYRAVDGKYNDLKICMRNIEKAKNVNGAEQVNGEYGVILNVNSDFVSFEIC